MSDVASGASGGLSRVRSSNISSAGMVTATDMVNLQHQLRQEVANVIHQVRLELNEIVNGRLDMLNGVAAAM